MAPRVRTRPAQRVSYREDSSDDVDEEESSNESEDEQPAPRRRQTKRKRSPLLSDQVSSRVRRQPRKTYAEEFSGDESSDFSRDDPLEFDDEAAEELRPSRPKKARNARKSINSPRKAVQIKEQADRPLPTRTKKVTISTPKIHVPFVSDGVIPPWSTLPYEVLQDIFSYASYPLFDDKNAPTANIAWLLKTARVSRTFLEPALAALYRCPPLLTRSTPHQVLALFSQDQRNHMIKYNVKVKRLELEYRILAYSAGKEYGAFDLGNLMKRLPQLTEIDIWSIFDIPRMRHFDGNTKQWTYPENLFDGLVAGGQKLRSFHWNGKLVGKRAEEPTKLYQWMHEIHLLAPFQALRCLALTNFLGDSESRIRLFEPMTTPLKPLTTTQQDKEAARNDKRQVTRTQDDALARAICTLPQLEMIDLHLCSVVDGEWLLQLPKNLTGLGISECDRLDSDGLQTFLKSHGSHLKQLVLNHNSLLGISFLTTLKSTCPHLEDLEMDLTYYSKFATSSAAEPEYENLLLPDEHPTWPSTLQSIEMHHLRQWTGSAAHNFFSSLIDSAEDLTNLRNLALSVSLNISWRERATLRDQWEEKFKRVFLRSSPPPNPYWTSLRGFREWKEKQNAKTLSHVEVKGVTIRENATEHDEDISRPTRRQNHTAQVASLPTPQQSDSGSTRRLRPRKMVSDSDEQGASAGPSHSLRDMVVQALEKHIQGMCDVVDIRIDNLRPTERQLHERDFLDSEPSGDEEWDEDRGDLDDEELYARKKGKGRGFI